MVRGHATRHHEKTVDTPPWARDLQTKICRYNSHLKMRNAVRFSAGAMVYQATFCHERCSLLSMYAKRLSVWENNNTTGHDQKASLLGTTAGRFEGGKILHRAVLPALVLSLIATGSR